MSKSQEQFILDGTSYHCFPNLDQFILEAGIDNATKREKIISRFDVEGITDITQLYIYTRTKYIELGISIKEANLLTQHLQILRRRSKLILTTQELRELEKEYLYLSTGNPSLDYILTYANQQVGLRSKTLVEFFGEAGIGKTQLLKTLAAMSLRSEKKSGWGKPVIYIDTEGSFDLSRFYQIAAYYDVSKQEVDNNLEVARAYNFDEVDDILTIIARKLRERECGMIILDSIIDPLKTQYPIDEMMSKLQERQSHLKQVCDKLKSLAQLHNLLVIISNQVRPAMDGTNRLIPQGGNVLAHATDMRFEISQIEQSEKEWYIQREDLFDVGIGMATINLRSCGFLPPGKSDMLVGPFGTADSQIWKTLVKNVKEQSHLSMNGTTVSGKKIEADRVRNELYG